MGTTTPVPDAPPATDDFADVFAEHLPAVWRYVRARVPDHHEAHDVTSDVFVRAWKAWDRFDVANRRVEPWLFTIASRAVADWWRARRPVEPVDPVVDLPALDADPEADVLREELLTQLGRALAGLSQRERDGLALRFAARLSSPHVADVLGCSTSAAKMLVHRAIQKLRGADLETAPGDGDAVADLEAVVDDVLARGHATIGDSDLHQLLVHLAVVHEAPVPSGLGKHVAFCVRCAATDQAVTGDGDPEDRDRGGDGGAGGTGGGVPGAAAVLAVPRRVRAAVRNALTALGVIVLGPLCGICGVMGAYTLVVAVGFSGVQLWHHYLGLAAGPLVLLLAWRAMRRTGDTIGWRLAVVGTWMVVAHVGIHTWYETTGAEWVAGTPLALLFGATDVVATFVLAAAAFVNAWEVSRWRHREAEALQARVQALASA